MSIGVWVGAEWEFGHVEPEAARRGGMQRAITLAIQQHVFDVDPALANRGEDKANARFARPLADFTEHWDSFQAQQAEVQALVDNLNSGRMASASDADSRSASSETKHPAEAAFALALYGLCWCLAVGRLPAITNTDEPEDETEEGEGEETDTAEAPPLGELATEFSRVRAEIAELVLQAMPKRKVEYSEPPGTRQHARLVADSLLESLLAAMPDTFKLEEQQLEIEDGEPRTRQRIVVRARDLRRRIEGLLEDFPYRVTAQPLRAPVHHHDADDLAEGNESRIHIPLIGYRRSNEFLNCFLKEALKGNGSAFNFKDYTHAVNVQQRVAWRLNAFVLRQAKLLAGLARDPAEWGDDVPAAAAGLDAVSLTELQAWVREKFFKPPPGERKRFELPGEFLDNVLAKAALKDLTTTEAADTPPAFYLPWKADYRGRIYAETPWLTPQGGDLQRALFEFAEGYPLDEKGVKALQRHGANLVARKRLLDDLGINGRHVAALEERERWVVQNEDNILRSAQSPLTHSFWREVASKPMQFLAFCHAYSQVKTNPNAHVHLPVQIDGTCNGLQHIAALTGDVALARAVNILPREDGFPADIYSDLAEAAQKTIGCLPPPEKSRSVLRAILTEADALLAKQPDLRELVSRNAAKKVVMTVPYGAGAQAQANGILREVLEPELAKLPANDPLWEAAQNWAKQLQANDGARQGFGKVGKSSFKFPPRAGEALKERLRTARILGSALAWVITLHIRRALDERHPIAPAFGKWLTTVAGQCEGLPLMWLTRLHLPVCQDHFREAKTSLNARLRGRTVRVGVTKLKEQVHERSQAQGLLPNLIHSLDATHLAMTINSARREGIKNIGTIHDCLLCHPNDAKKLGIVVRDTFIDLYRCEGGAARPAVLEDWTDWMNFIAQLAAFPNPHRLVGALDAPGGLAEMNLRMLEDGSEPEKAEAREARALLSELKGFDEPRKALARMLLDYAARVPIATQEAARPNRKRHSFPPVCADEKPAPAPKFKSEPGSLPHGELSLTNKKLSKYFFS